MAEQKHAKYLAKDGEVKLFHGDDVEDALTDGWEYPANNKSNGEPWNPEPEDGELYVNDAQAEVQRANTEAQAKKDAAKAKAQEDAQKAAEAAQEKESKAAQAKLSKSKE